LLTLRKSYTTLSSGAYRKKKSKYTLNTKQLFNELVEMDENDLPFAVSDFDSENVSDFIKAFEDNMNKKKIKRRKGLEVFLEEEEAPDEDSSTR
jgi:hypothetical protein